MHAWQKVKNFCKYTVRAHNSPCGVNDTLESKGPCVQANKSTQPKTSMPRKGHK